MESPGEVKNHVDDDDDHDDDDDENVNDLHDGDNTAVLIMNMMIRMIASL